MKAYAPHERFVDPARSSAALIQTVAGFIAIEFFYALLRHLVDYLALNLAPEASVTLAERVTWYAILFDLFAFALLALVVVWVCWRNHDRGWRTLTGPLPVLRHDLPRALAGAGALFVVVEFLLPWWAADHVDMQSLPGWLALLPLTLLALFVQTGAEELFYRGYLQQQVAARWSSPLVWMVLPNIAFASVHWVNGTGFTDQVGYVIWAFCFGVAASDLVARSGSLGAAIGFHMANNAYAFLFVGERDAPDSGLALYLYPPLPPYDGPPGSILDLGLAIDLSLVLLAWLAVRVAIRR